MLKPFLVGVKQLLYPSICVNCRELLTESTVDFCASCIQMLTSDRQFTCPRCCSSVAETQDVSDGCPSCYGEKLHYDFAIRLGIYEGPLRDIILAMKYSSGESLAESMGRLWATQLESRLKSEKIDLVVPIPLHWWRRMKRGYNQSERLSEAIAARLKIPHRPHWLKRFRYTQSQTLQTPTSRRYNIRGAFKSSRTAEFKDKTILLVDDVVTTGSTASEAAKVMKEAGARRIILAVLAHR